MSNRSCNCLTAVDKLRPTIRLAALCLAIVSLHASTYGQTVTMALDTNVIAIGDQTRLTITATRGITQNQHKFNWPTWKDSLPGGLELIGEFDSDTSAVDLNDGSMAFAIRRSYVVTCWDSGYVAIPPVGIAFGSDTIRSNPLGLNVLLSPPGEAGKIAAAADIRETEWTLGERIKQWLPWLLGSLASIALIALIAWKWRMRDPIEKKKTFEAPKPKEAAHITALRELEAIEEQALWKKGEVKRHHARTNEVLRKYLEGRFEFRALERSTDEIKTGISSLPILNADREILLEILEMTDLVKFAKWSPSADDHIRIVKRAMRFIEQTLPTPEATESNPAS